MQASDLNLPVNLADTDQARTLRLGTRTSQLALWQTNHVAALLQQRWPQLQCEFVHLVTQGDKRLDRPLPEIGGKGLFTAELEEALRRGEIDVAVHSLKDLPVENPDELIIGAILSREDTRDVLVARGHLTLATLPTGAIVGTSSLRRKAQLLAARPDLDVRSIRGNVDTRLRKVFEGEYDAAVLAGAGLSRLGLTAHISEWIAPDIMLSAPGQGALAVQCRADDAVVKALLATIHDSQAATATYVERQLLFLLGGGCSAPVGAWATMEGDEIELRARIASTDGQHVFDAHGRGRNADQVAREAAEALMSQGAHIALNREDAPLAQPLAGKRVVVTRPLVASHEGNDELVRGLAQAGALPLHLPGIKIVPIPDSPGLSKAAHQLATYDWVIFTSPNAVEQFWTSFGDMMTGPLHQPAHVAAVGPATKAALLARGWQVDVMPAEFVGSEIAATLGEVQGKRILLPRSAMGSPDLPATLRAGGAHVDEIALYAPTPIVLDEQARATLLRGIDVIAFASGSAAAAFADSLRADARFHEFWSGVSVACIGPTTANAAREAGLPVHVVATEHNVRGLIAALAAHFSQGKTY